jgi:DNA-binding MarR family transcriptional regulator
MLDRLEEAGLIERRRDEADRRAWRIHLTEAATPVIRRLEAMGVGFNADIVEGIDEAERAIASAVLARIRANLERIEQVEQAS